MTTIDPFKQIFEQIMPIFVQALYGAVVGQLTAVFVYLLLMLFFTSKIEKQHLIYKANYYCGGPCLTAGIAVFMKETAPAIAAAFVILCIIASIISFMRILKLAFYEGEEVE